MRLSTVEGDQSASNECRTLFSSFSRCLRENISRILFCALIAPASPSQERVPTSSAFPPLRPSAIASRWDARIAMFLRSSALSSISCRL